MGRSASTGVTQRIHGSEEVCTPGLGDMIPARNIVIGTRISTLTMAVYEVVRDAPITMTRDDDQPAYSCG